MSDTQNTDNDPTDSDPTDTVESGDRPLEWANDPHMSAVDTIMWRGDTDRRMRGTISMLEIYDCVPDWDLSLIHI